MESGKQCAATLKSWLTSDCLCCEKDFLVTPCSRAGYDVVYVAIRTVCFGEDGCIQGLLEFCTFLTRFLASAMGTEKELSARMSRCSNSKELTLPQVPSS